jgi:hypothetical protein
MTDKPKRPRAATLEMSRPVVHLGGCLAFLFDRSASQGVSVLTEGMAVAPAAPQQPKPNPPKTAQPFQSASLARGHSSGRYFPGCSIHSITFDAVGVIGLYVGFSGSTHHRRTVDGVTPRISASWPVVMSSVLQDSLISNGPSNTGPGFLRRIPTILRDSTESGSALNAARSLAIISTGRPLFLTMMRFAFGTPLVFRGIFVTLYCIRWAQFRIIQPGAQVLSAHQRPTNSAQRPAQRFRLGKARPAWRFYRRSARRPVPALSTPIWALCAAYPHAPAPAPSPSIARRTSLSAKPSSG